MKAGKAIVDGSGETHRRRRTAGAPIQAAAVAAGLLGTPLSRSHLVSSVLSLDVLVSDLDRKKFYVY
ncbi:hypothetical protein Hanom_Chr07g00647301 [Helianthus anomalus]